MYYESKLGKFRSKIKMLVLIVSNLKKKKKNVSVSWIKFRASIKQNDQIISIKVLTRI